nr:C-C motif chemokine 27 [Cavia porcellus]XP_023421272.1 C-C motif chemokine 27 [Cavia porcellus]
MPQVKCSQIKGMGEGAERSKYQLRSMKELFLPTSILMLLLLLLSPDPGAASLLQPITTCCTQLYRRPLPNKILRKVIWVELQEADGDCHLQAFVLYLTERSVCVHPKNRSLIQWLERHGKRFQGTLRNPNLGL